MKPWERRYATPGSSAAPKPWERQYAAPPPAPAAPPPDVVIPDPNRPPPAPPEDPDYLGHAARKLQLGAQGVGRGLADVIGLPADLLAPVLNLGLAGAGAATRAAGSAIGNETLAEATLPRVGSASDTIAQLASSVSPIPLIDQEQMTDDERLLHTVNRFGAGGAAGGAAVAQKAAQTAQMAPRVASAFGDPAKAGTTFAADVAGGVGAGTAVGTVDNAMADDASPITRAIATALAALAGGAGGASVPSLATAPADAARNAARRVFRDDAVAPDPETGLRPSRADTRRAAAVAQKEAVDPETAAANITGARQYARGEGLPASASGQLSDDEGLLRLERRARLNDPTPFARRDREVRTAAGENLRAIRPEEAADPRVATNEITRQVEGARGAAAANVTRAQDRVDTTQAAITETRARQGDIVAPMAAERGQEASASRQIDRTVVDETLVPRTREKNAQFAEIDPDRSIAASPAVKEAAKRIAAREDPAAPLPREFSEQLAKVSGDQPASIGDLVEMRPNLKDAAERARKSGNFRLADDINGMRTTVNAEIDRLAEAGGPGSDAAARAQAYYREEYAPFFAEGPGRKFRDAVQRDDLARTATPPTATAEQFLFSGGGSEEAARALRRIVDIAPNPEAGRQAVRKYIRARLARTLDAEGRTNFKRVNKWVQDHREMLAEFPAIRDEVFAFRRGLERNRQTETKLGRELLEASRALRRADADRAATEARIGRSHLSVMLDKEPTRAAASVFSSGDPEKAMREVVTALKGNKEALTAWRHAVTDHLEEALTNTNVSQTLDGSNPVSWAKAHRLFNKERAALQVVYGPDEMNRLQRVHKLLEPMLRSSVRSTDNSATAENFGAILNPVELIARWKLGHLPAGGLMRSLKMAIAQTPGLDRQEAVDRLLVRMQLEPEIAERLLAMPGVRTDAAPPPSWSAKLRRLLAAGAGARELNEGQENDGSSG